MDSWPLSCRGSLELGLPEAGSAPSFQSSGDPHRSGTSAGTRACHGAVIWRSTIDRRSYRAAASQGGKNESFSLASLRSPVSRIWPQPGAFLDPSLACLCSETNASTGNFRSLFNHSCTDGVRAGSARRRRSQVYAHVSVWLSEDPIRFSGLSGMHVLFRSL